jgi:hypothetical protein
MINIYKLRYENKEAALKDLIAKEVINIERENINGTEAVVDCGIITLVYATETEPASFAEGYHYNIMTTKTIIFDSEVFPKKAKYKFAGED